MDLSIPDHSVLPNRTSFPLPSQSYPNPLRSLRGSSTLASSSPSPNPNYWEFWEPWFHCPHFCLLQADLRPRKESVGGGAGLPFLQILSPRPKAPVPLQTSPSPAPQPSRPYPYLQLSSPWLGSSPLSGTWQGLGGGEWEGTTNRTDKRMSRECLQRCPAF